MASGVRLFGESVHPHLTDMQNQLRMSSYTDRLNTTHPFSFTNTTANTPLWSHVNFVPEKIIDWSVTMDGGRVYKIQWHHSWVAEHQLLPFQHVLQDFWTDENDFATKSNAVSKKLVAPKQNSTKLPSISNLSSKAKQKDNSLSSATNESTVKPSLTTVAPGQITLPSSGGKTDEDAPKVNNEISGKSVKTSECEHLLGDPTLATDVANSEIGNTVNKMIGGSVNTTIGNTLNTEIENTVVNQLDIDKVNTENKDTPPLYLEQSDLGKSYQQEISKDKPASAEQSDQARCYEQEIRKVVAFKLKHERLPGRTVNCDGLDILAVENTSVTDDMVRIQAREIVGSFKKKRRKYENGESANDPHSCFFCTKVLSSGKRLRLHNFTVHLKHFGYLSCESCQQRFFYPRHLKAHKKMHSEERNIVCEICQAVFKSDNGLWKHKEIHLKESNFRCDVCHKNFKLQDNLKTHCMEEHKNDSGTCNVCKAKLKSGHSVYVHSLRHSGTRDYECDKCGRAFKRKQHLVEHKKTHLPKKDMECPVCKRKVSGRNALSNHITLFHQEYSTACNAKFKCSICDKPFRHKGKLGIHMKLKHANDTREEYQKRNKEKNKRRGERIRKAMNISDRELAHLSEKIEKVTNEKTGEVRLRCKMCAQTYKIVSWMEKHLEDHKNGKWKRRDIHVCKDCGVKFKFKYHLFKHRNHHCRVRKGKTSTPKIVSVEDIHANVVKITDIHGKIRFKCKICPNREFLMVRAMKNHLQDHKNGEVIEISKNQVEHLCEECGKSFKTKKRLQLHHNISHQKSNTCGDSSKAELGSINGDDPTTQKTNRKRKQQLPMKFHLTGKRSAALNAKSILHLQVHEISSAEEDEVEELEDAGSDNGPCDEGNIAV